MNIRIHARPIARPDVKSLRIKPLTMLLACSMALGANMAMGRALPPLHHDVVFVENNVAGYQALLNGISSGSEIHVLSGATDGLAEMAKILSGRKDIDAVHLVSHGSRGALQLGSLTLNAQNLNARAADLAAIGNALKRDGGILLYGCDVAKGADGAAFVTALARHTHTSVAASTDLTGARAKGGNWALEYATGRIGARHVFSTESLADYQGTLPANAPPSIDLNGSTPGTGNTVTLPGAATRLATTTATAADAENDLGNWAGGSLSLQRVTGGGADGSVNDVFNFTAGASFDVSGGSIVKGADANGILVANRAPVATWTYTSATGKLVVNFNAEASTAVVQDVVRNIGYSNATPYGDATIRFTLNDGSGNAATADAVVTSSTIYVDQTTYDTSGSAANGFNLAEALAIAKDGDSILIQDGTYRGQFSATAAVTINALNGAGHVTLEAPDHADLVASGTNTINGKTRFPILNLQTAVPGSGTVTVRNLRVDGRYQGDTQAQSSSTSNILIGIAAYDSNVLIDNVNVQHVAAPLDGTGSYEGMSRHFGILAEGSSALSSTVTATIQNSTIGTFQKAGINAWGPKLNAIIANNHISGVGTLGRSGQNGIQVGSLAPRDGTTATISGNTIDNLGAPADLVSTGYVATGFYPVSGGAVEAFGNTVTLSATAGADSLMGSDISYGSAAANLHDNTFNGMAVGIQVDMPLHTAVHHFSNNTLTTAGGDPIVFYYDPLNNGDTGGETIANFGIGSSIRVIGENFSSGTASLGTGSSVAPNSIQVSVSGGNTILYIDTTVANSNPSSPPLAITLNGVYQLSNFVLSGEYVRFKTASYTGPLPGSGGTGTATLTGGGPNCGFTAASFVSLSGGAGAPPTGYTFPFGLFDFKLGNCTPGAPVTLTIDYGQALPSNMVYWKYGPTPTPSQDPVLDPNAGPTPHWYQVAATPSGSTMSFTITDGGLGDDDLTANGTIADPGGPAVSTTPAKIPTLGQGAGLLLSILMATFGLAALKREPNRKRAVSPRT